NSNMKNSLQKKLKSYSALAGAVAATASVNAQIIYTDVIPNDTINTTLTGVNIDLDNGGVVDFMVDEQTGVTSSGYAYNEVLSVVPQNGVNAIAENGILGAFVLNAALNSGDTIDAALTLATDTVQFAARVYPASTTYNFGNWIGAVDKYFGLRFNLAGTTHYGWARFDVAVDGSSFILKDYAYDATADALILAGAMSSSGIEELLAHNTMIFGFDKSISVKIMNNASIEGVITVTDVLGQLLASVNVTSDVTIIPMTDAKSGVYFATITKKDGSRFTKKLFLK
ncbi:MAG: T9SS type A sorting domain-containing protein, partial [Bacteroidetes bacterium]|nr:T9SS type A sorting domain-containing protein [Bacteroidota bacterium]